TLLKFLLCAIVILFVLRCKGTNYFGLFQIIREIFGIFFFEGGENADIKEEVAVAGITPLPPYPS
ncbi:MAG: hypothetical protein Q4D33_11590, partial [Prevotellaceae bacterium]|nr:hypothetical protein [Prevotellaceae bacterium]